MAGERHEHNAMHRMFRSDDVDWDRVAARQASRADLAPVFWRLAGGRAGLRVADVGCGPGFFALRYAEWTGPTGRVLAVDLAPDALARVEAQRDPARHAALHTARVDVEREPLPERGFDAILLTNVLHHAADPRPLLARLRGAASLLVVAEFDPAGPGEDGPPTEDRLGPDALATMLRDAGWAPDAPVALAHEMYAVVARPA